MFVFFNISIKKGTKEKGEKMHLNPFNKSVFRNLYTSLGKDQQQKLI